MGDVLWPGALLALKVAEEVVGAPAGEDSLAVAKAEAPSSAEVQVS